MEITRRGVLGLMASTAAAAATELQAAAQTVGGDAASLNWLGGAPPPSESGVSWGVPWKRGAVRKEQTFALTGANGAALPVQSWTLAYWPDGSVKWTGFATVAGPAATGALQVAPGSPAAPAQAVKVTDGGAAVAIDTGKLQCRVPRSGPYFLDALTLDGRVVAAKARLVCTLKEGARFSSAVRKVTVEQPGPVRAVVRIDGVHKAESGTREWLPFVVRLYFHAGLEQVRLIHTVVFDGDDRKDFISGLGVAVSVPLREQVHNRHVRFAGEDGGLWSEPVEPLSGRRLLGAPGSGNVYADQLAGKRIPNREAFNAGGQKLIDDLATWDAYKLVQPNADGFTIHKRANPQSCWLDPIGGRRSSGLVFVGDVTGGLAVGVKNFWQSYPASLEVQGATKAEAEVTAWLWSPDAPAMDLRHYDTRAHGLESSYEDVQPGFSTPHGVARTSELMLFPCAATPSKQETGRQVAMSVAPPVLTPAPEHLHSTGVFGVWSLPDRSTPAKSALEDQLDAAFAVYHKEVDQRHWYGFWNFGDVMHQYDGPRHEWRYDIGGFAWDNSELGTDMWLWYTFLRSGRADVFRMAEAMTRHTGEVDVYHLGRFATLGSRHNVRHWGCGAKEPRISQAAYRRFYYYLTTDERTGDLMREVVDADYKATEIDTMREAQPRTGPIPYPGRVRGGPDWLAFAGNWMTEWERTGNTKYRDKILTGMDSIAAMKYGFLTGPNQLYGYDPKTGKLYALEEKVGTYNLATIMGGGEVVFELNSLIEHEGWKKAWNQYSRLHLAKADVIERDKATGKEGEDGQYARPGRLSGYLYMQTKNPAFAAKAWAGVTGGPMRPRGPRYSTVKVEGAEVVTPIEEVPNLSTNGTAQGSLELIEVLEMCGDRIG